jgi:plasmid stability protein
MQTACMATLQIRDLPDELYRTLRRAAEAERRSLTQEAVVALERGLRAQAPAEARDRRRRLLEEARLSPVPLPPDAPSPDAVVREDRDR